MPFLWGRRFGVPSSISGPFVNAMLLLGAAGLGGYSLARLAGNPVRIHMDENGVWKWMSRVEYEHWLLSVSRRCLARAAGLVLAGAPRGMPRSPARWPSMARTCCPSAAGALLAARILPVPAGRRCPSRAPPRLAPALVL